MRTPTRLLLTLLSLIGLATGLALSLGQAEASPPCPNDPSGRRAVCCEGSGYIWYAPGSGLCYCGDDNGNPVNVCF